MLFCISLFLFIRKQKRYHSDADHVMFSRLHNPVRVEIESRLLLVPVVFIFLRVWDLLGSIIFVYHPSPALQHNNHWLQPLTVSFDNCISVDESFVGFAVLT